MQSGEIDLGAIYILVRAEALQADEQTGGGEEWDPASGGTSMEGGRLAATGRRGCTDPGQGVDLYKGEPLP